MTVGTIVAISNEKGGTGKTTLAVNLGAALAIRGRKTLLIDMDPQGNASYILAKITDEDPAMYSVLTEKDIALDAIIQPTATEHLDIAPSNLHLAGAEIQLATLLGRENALKRKLSADIINRYDFLLIDTSPSLGLLTINALNAADYALIPVSCDFLSLVGLTPLRYDPPLPGSTGKPRPGPRTCGESLRPAREGFRRGPERPQAAVQHPAVRNRGPGERPAEGGPVLPSIDL